MIESNCTNIMAIDLLFKHNNNPNRNCKTLLCLLLANLLKLTQIIYRGFVMNIKILFKVFTVLFITVLPLQTNASVLNLGLSGILCATAGVTGIEAKKCWEKLKTHEVVAQAQQVAIHSGRTIKALFNNDNKEFDKQMNELKSAAIRLKDKAAPTAGWCAATVICAGLSLRLFLHAL